MNSMDFNSIINKLQHWMSLRARIRYSSRFKTESTQLTQPFDQSISIIVIQKCHKLQTQIQKKSKKQLLTDLVVKSLINALNKDILLLHKNNQSYARLNSLVCNTKANYYHKIDDFVTALNFVDQALEYQKLGEVDVIDTARTLLNKSVILGQLARAQQQQQNPQRSRTLSFQPINKTQKKQENLYSHEAAIGLAKQALEIIKNRGSRSLKKNSSQINQEYKLGQIIIISFHNIATQLSYLKNQVQAYALYKKAYDLAIKILGGRHSLTKHLKQIICEYKQKSLKAKQQEENPSIMLASQKQREQKSYSRRKLSSKKVTNYNSFRARNKTFYKIYHEDTTKRLKSKNDSFRHLSNDNSESEMKDLKKIQKIYDKPSSKSYFPEIRKNTKDILKQGKFLKIKPIKNAQEQENKTKTQQKLQKIEVKDIQKSQVPKIQKNQPPANDKKEETKIQTIKQDYGESKGKDSQKDSDCQLI